MVRPNPLERRLPFPDISPIAFQLGPLAVRWYALGYLFGVLLGALYGMTLLKRKSLWANGAPPFPAPAIWDFAFWAIIGIVVGGRTGYVLFYNLPLYLSHPLEIFQLWDGGMAFHGGLVGLIVAVALFSRSKGGNLLSAIDLMAACAPIGIFLVRCANFINGELYGRETTLPWVVIFPNGGPLPRHPSQLYEAGLEGILLFTILAVLIRFGALKRPGLIVGSFIALYGLARITGEHFREPDPQLGFLWGGLTMGMLLSVPMVIAGIIVIVWAWRQKAPQSKAGS